MNDQQVRPAPEQPPYRPQGAGGVDLAYARLVCQLGGLGEIVEGLRSHFGFIRSKLPGSGRLARAFRGLESALEEFVPIWTPAKHRDLTEGASGGGYFEAFDWLRRFDPDNATPAKASSLARRCLSFARQASSGEPDWGDSVIELLHKRRVRRYFFANHLRLVHVYGWSVKNAKFAKACWQIAELGALVGPVLPPEPTRQRKTRRER